MSADSDHDGAWFAPKRYGYGSGLPIAWQGWLTLGLYFGVVGLYVLMEQTGHSGARIAGAIVLAIATAIVVVICARHTRGGWKWRWGGED